MADENTTRQITIQGVTATISTPYVAGHPITEAEAKGLNQLRAENIRNNLASRVKEAKELHGEDAKALQKAVNALVAEYDANYEFTLASVGGGGRASLSPVEKEARSIAREHLNALLRDKGITQKDYKEANGEDAIKIKIEEFASHPKIVKLAEEVIAERQKNADVAKDLAI